MTRGLVGYLVMLQFLKLPKRFVNRRCRSARCYRICSLAPLAAQHGLVLRSLLYVEAPTAAPAAVLVHRPAGLLGRALSSTPRSSMGARLSGCSKSSPPLSGSMSSRARFSL